MPHAKFKRSHKLDPRGPLVFDIRTLGSASARLETASSYPLRANSALVWSRADGAEMRFGVELEDVTGRRARHRHGSSAAGGECARCLDEFTSTTSRWIPGVVRAAEADDSARTGTFSMVICLTLSLRCRDALVLELPLSPLCAADCAGLCSTCGVRLADAEPDHAHESDGGVWAVLKNLFPAEGAGQASGEEWSAIVSRDDRSRRVGGVLRWQYRSGRCRAAIPGRGARSGRPLRRLWWRVSVSRAQAPHTACPTCGTYNTASGNNSLLRADWVAAGGWSRGRPWTSTVIAGRRNGEHAS